MAPAVLNAAAASAALLVGFGEHNGTPRCTMLGYSTVCTTEHFATPWPALTLLHLRLTLHFCTTLKCFHCTLTYVDLHTQYTPLTLWPSALRSSTTTHESLAPCFKLECFVCALEYTVCSGLVPQLCTIPCHGALQQCHAKQHNATLHHRTWALSEAAFSIIFCGVHHQHSYGNTSERWNCWRCNADHASAVCTGLFTASEHCHKCKS